MNNVDHLVHSFLLLKPLTKSYAYIVLSLSLSSLLSPEEHDADNDKTNNDGDASNYQVGVSLLLRLRLHVFNEALGVFVKGKAHLVVFEIIYAVKGSQEDITENNHVH